MVRKITQETFNETVKENVELLGITLEEAIEEAIKQFEDENVDLSNISKKILDQPFDDKVIPDAIEKLKQANIEKVYKEEVLKALDVLKEQCQKGLDHQVLAGKLGAYEQILTVVENNKDDNGLKSTCFKAFIALMTKQPDLLDDKGVELILENIDVQNEPGIINLCLKWARECCIFHEMNRQKIFNANILSKLKILLVEPNNNILRSVLSLFRALVLDDDIRVEFGKAHDHAKGIAMETLQTLTNLLNKWKSDENLVNDLLLTISNLLVRHEFCTQVTEAGGLDTIKELMTEHSQSEKINRQCFKLLKAMAGNDVVKVQTINKGIAPLISAALGNTKSVAGASAGLSCVAALCLRSPENSKVMFDSGVPEEIVRIMKNFPGEKTIQKTGSWAIRNMVSRSKYQCGHFKELGIEEVLKEAFKNFKECEYDIKSALRDLGCDVEFKEEWTGKGGLLNHDQ